MQSFHALGQGPPGGLRLLLEEADAQLTGLAAIPSTALGALAWAVSIAGPQDVQDQLSEERPDVGRAHLAFPRGVRWAQPALRAPQAHPHMPPAMIPVPPQAEENAYMGRAPGPGTAVALEPVGRWDR